MLQFCLQRTRATFLTMSGYSSFKIMLFCVGVTTNETLVLSSCMGKRKDALIKHINEIFFFFLILQILFYSGSGISCKLIESFLQHVYIHIIPATHSEIFTFLSDCASYQHLLCQFQQLLNSAFLPSSDVSQLPLHALWNRLPAAVSLIFPPL